MKLFGNIPWLSGVVQCGLLLFGGTSLYGSVVYTFDATTRAAPGSPSHTEIFRLELADFLPMVQDADPVSFLANDPVMETCTPCVGSPIPALHFLRTSTGDLLQFADLDGTTRLYTFTVLALSQPGAHTTIPGINTNLGQLNVASTPEPSVVGTFAAGTFWLAWLARRRRSLCAHDEAVLQSRFNSDPHTR